MIDYICGILDYCYNGVPIVRGYASYKTLVKYSYPHPAYQRHPEDQHVKEIEEFISRGTLKFMPEVILSYNYSGISLPTSDDDLSLKDPIRELYNARKNTVFEDFSKGITLTGSRKRSGLNFLKMKIDTKSPFYQKLK